jgi:ubiquinone biosynthesis protein UbiJ
MNPAVSALAQWAEVLVNSALSLDPVAEARLRRLDGVSFRIVSTLPEEELNVRCVGARLLLARGPIDKPNVIVTGTSQALLAALTGIGRPDVTVEGDETLLDELRAIVRNLSPDFSRPLAPLIGEEGAAALTGFVSAGAKMLRSFAAAIDSESTRWIRSGLHSRVATSPDLDRFADKVTRLRLAVDRLDARVRLLEAHAERRRPT